MAGREEIGRHCPYCGAIISYDEFFCRACHKRIEDQQGLDAPSTARPEVRVVAIRNPAVAALLSFAAPGLGQLYNGQTLKGIAVIAIFIAVSFGMIAAEFRAPLFFAIWAAGIADAFWSARQINHFARSFTRASRLLYILLAIYAMIIGLFLYTGQPDEAYLGRLFPPLAIRTLLPF